VSINVTVPGFHSRFPNTSVSSADVGSIWLFEAAAWVHGELAEKFVVPFSDNNTTASRLAYQKAWHLLRLRTLDPDDSDEMGEALNGEVQRLRDGETAMMLDDGTAIYATVQQTDPQGTIWSSTMNYEPTFTEDDPKRQVVDDDKIRNIRSDRSGTVRGI